MGQVKTQVIKICSYQEAKLKNKGKSGSNYNFPYLPEETSRNSALCSIPFMLTSC